MRETDVEREIVDRTASRTTAGFDDEREVEIGVLVTLPSSARAEKPDRFEDRPENVSCRSNEFANRGGLAGA